MFHHHRILAIIGSLAVVAMLGYAILEIASLPENKFTVGVSFDPVYARYLGLDTKALFATILDDWHFKHLRLAVFWDEVEKTSGALDFKELDYWFKEAQKRGAKIILAIGQKTPRWPECHDPSWVKDLSAAERRAKLLALMQSVVERYRDNPALETWQVENEPFLGFGICPAFSRADLTQEITLVKKLDPVHPILITDSGELSSWLQTARAGDLFGTTMYRVVWNKYIGYFSYDWLPASFYRFKLWLTGRARSEAYIAELQGEPWIPNTDVKHLPFDKQFKSLDLARLKKNINYASRVGFSRAYLWGAEWWAWAKTQGHPEFADYIKNLPKN